MEHIPVLQQQCVEALITQRDGTQRDGVQQDGAQRDGAYIDATFGRGGHSKALLSNLSAKATLVACDRDPIAIDNFKQNFNHEPRASIHYCAFSQLHTKLQPAAKYDGILFDLGVSSPQLEHAERGFSFNLDGPLDMRMDNNRGISAYQWLLQKPQNEIEKTLIEYGDERYARRIAAAIVAARNNSSLPDSTLQLAKLISQNQPRKDKNKHPATRSFQAIRIAVNNEINELQQALNNLFPFLKVGGRIAVITFNSNEGRLVKNFVAMQRGKCKMWGKFMPQREEKKRNARSRSAVLRVFTKTNDK